MKRLLYTVAHGDPVYLRMAQACVDSARRHGHDGDALVLSDRAHRFEGADCVKIAMGEEKGEDLLAKAGLLRALSPAEIGAYDQVLFLDADCVFTASAERVFSLPGLRIAPQGHFDRALRASYNLIFLTEREKIELARANTPKINTGMLLMPGAEAAEFLADWEAFWRACPRRELGALPKWRGFPPNLMDQPALQAMLWRTGRAWSAFPPGTMGFPLYGGGGNAPILHFCGQVAPGMSREESKWALYARMRAAAGLAPAA